METLNCDDLTTRAINARLRALPDGASAVIDNPRGRHNLAVGLDGDLDVRIRGNAGYFIGGLCGRPGCGPRITVDGWVGWSVGENLMGGTVTVLGSASESAAASARGGTVAIHGNASLRAGISLKGGDLAVAGDVGAMSGFMAQAGTILVGGDAGHGLGDSIYEAVIYVGGAVRSLGADAEEQDLTDDDVLAVKRLVEVTGFDHVDPSRVRRFGSARRLYHFSGANHRAY